MRLAALLIPICVILTIVLIVGWAAGPPKPVAMVVRTPDAEFLASVEHVNAELEQTWEREALEPADPAEPLTVLRRLSLALHGTIPSLEEIRAFERDEGPHRLWRWTERLLDDPRFPAYLAERLARSLVGTENGAFVIYRRDQFVQWLAEQLGEKRPYDELVRDLISEQGLWTGQPATNFVMAAYANDDLDENKLAGRTVRAFLGQRIDCAQCHDHPFDLTWKQHHFEGLAAFYGQTRLTIVGVEDKAVVDGAPVEYAVEDRATLEKAVVLPCVPFEPDWLPVEGTRRERLAAWITHPENRRFERAAVNRLWGLLFGKPFIAPVDDLPHPGPERDLLDLLGDDFREHGYDLRRLIQLIVHSRPFQLDSRAEASDSRELAQREMHWAVFPLVRLRPEQVVGSMFQAAHVQTVNQNSHLLIRFQRLISERDFLNEYGDLGQDELDEQTGTIPQALLRMNGKLSSENVKADFLKAPASIAQFAPSDASCVEAVFLACLSRRPEAELTDFFVGQLESADSDEARKGVVEDLYWILFNSPEFSWNH